MAYSCFLCFLSSLFVRNPCYYYYFLKLSHVFVLDFYFLLFGNVACSNCADDSWFPRSLFIVGVHLLACVEDLLKFGSLLVDPSPPSYYSLDSYCSISDISEMVSHVINQNFFSLYLFRS